MNRHWAFAALGLLLAGAASPALADEHDPAKVEKQKIVIITERHGNGGETHASADRRDVSTIVAGCEGDRNAVSAEDETDGKKTKIVLCTRGDANPADRAKRLEHALERINSNDELSADAKAKITMALREAIARMNAPAR